MKETQFALGLDHDRAAFDRNVRQGAIKYIIGVDEAGRGCLAGPMFAGAVLLPAEAELNEINDSKRLTVDQRTRLASKIKSTALAWGVAQVSAAEIDERGLDWANRIVFTRAVRVVQKAMPRCTKENTFVLVDGIRPAYRCPFPHRTVKGGDHRSLSIAAASILAKTARDEYCTEVMDKKFPEYGFAQHKGYATAAHYLALEQHGPSPIHRHSYRLTRSS